MFPYGVDSLPPVPDVHLPESLADPITVGQTPSGTPSYSGSTIDATRTGTVSSTLGGVRSPYDLLAQPLVLNTSLASSPLPWLQLQLGGGNTGASAQVQVSQANPTAINPSLLIYGGFAPGQQPGSSPWTPSYGATGILEGLVGDASRPDLSLGVNAGFMRTPYASGILTDVTGINLAASLSGYIDYWRDAPAANTRDHRPVPRTTTPFVALGLAASLLQLWGDEGVLNQLGFDSYLTVTSRLLNVRGAPMRLFLTVTPGVRYMLRSTPPGPDTHGWGISGFLTVGAVFGEVPRPGPITADP